MRNTIIGIICFLILIGVIGLSVNVAFGNQTITYLERIRIYDYTGLNSIGYYYKFDFSSYARNLNTAITDVSILELKLQERTWEEIDASIIEAEFWVTLGNNLAYLVNWLIMIANVILYPIRLGAYLVRQSLAIMGVNMSTATNNGLWWLVKFVNFGINQFWIPYI